jgi:drug/metabolite transporter (DMT)-like permease
MGPQRSGQTSTGSAGQPGKARRPAAVRAWAALLVVWVVWGSTYIAIRVGDESMPPFVMSGVRYLIAGSLLFPVALLSGGTGQRATGKPGLRQWLSAALVGTMLLGAGNGSVAWAERTLPAGLAALLVATVPIWMVLADRVINRRAISRTGWLALAVGIGGVAVLARPHGHGQLGPMLIVLCGAMSWGTGSVLAGRLPLPARPLLGSAMEMLAGGTVLSCAAILGGQLSGFDPAHVSGRSLLALAYLIGPGSLLAMTCYVVALGTLPTATVSTYAYVNPVVAVSLAALLLNERLTLNAAAGGAAIVVSVALLLLRRPVPAATASTDRAGGPAGAAELAETAS